MGQGRVLVGMAKLLAHIGQWYTGVQEKTRKRMAKIINPTGGQFGAG